MPTNRRTFLVNGARLAGGLLLASCAPAAGPATATSAPVVKKDLVIAAAVEVADGQPYNQSRGDTYGQIFSALYDTVTGRDNEFKVQPRLATSWSALNATTWQFKLRSGVKFHNGDPMTAADVKWSIEHTYDPAAKTIYATTFDTIARIDVIDDLTVNVVTKVPDPFMPQKLSVRPGYVMPSKYFQSVGIAGMDKNPVGSGPYMFKERVQGVSFTMVRNPDYWRGRPDADSITVIIRPESAARIAALKAGEADLVVNVPFDSVDDLTGNAATKVVNCPDNGVTMFVINTNAKPLDNKLIRQALSLSIDRAGLNRSLYKGTCRIASSWIGSFDFGFDSALPPLAFDQTRAKSLMQQAGYAGEKISLEYNPQGTVVLLEQALAEQWKAVGFNIELVPMDAATRARKIANLGFLGITWARFASRYGDPDSVVWRTLQPRGSLRYWSDPEVDRLGAEQAASTDQALRQRHWQRINTILLDQMPMLWLWEQPILWGASRRIDLVPTMDSHDDLGPGHITFKS
jgi:peptide/nickel transport system substrate-binding protein